jgi:hypothetical protein
MTRRDPAQEDLPGSDANPRWYAQDRKPGICRSRKECGASARKRLVAVKPPPEANKQPRQRVEDSVSLLWNPSQEEADMLPPHFFLVSLKPVRVPTAKTRIHFLCAKVKKKI